MNGVSMVAGAVAGDANDRKALKVDSEGRLLLGAGGGALPVSFYWEPTIAAGAYTPGDAIGEKKTLTDVAVVAGESVILDTLTIGDEANQAADLVVLFFQSGSQTVTDNAAFAWGAGDLAHLVGAIEIAAADYIAVGAGGEARSVVSLSNLGLVLKLSSSSRDLMVALVAKGTPNYGAAGKLNLFFGFRR